MGVAAAAAAWTAFAVALLALLVALAQVLQQYVSTAQGMRTCDSLVWGPMPGKSGRRKWVWHQLRFKVIFEMPNVFIPTEYWWTPGNARSWPSHRTTSLPTPFKTLSVTGTNSDDEMQQCSEACWVSFARQINHACPGLVQIGLLYGDMDRIPPDLCVVPMQVSLRDVIALGLLLGMTINLSENGQLEMHGPRSSLISSKHQVLGDLVHFSSISTAMRFRNVRQKSGNVSKSWFHRLQGIATVAQKPYTEEARSYYQQLGFNWRAYRRKLLTDEVVLPCQEHEEDRPVQEKKPFQLVFTSIDGRVHVVDASKCSNWDELQKTLEEENIATPPYVIKLLHPDHHSNEFPELKDGFRVGPQSWNRVLHIMTKDAPNLAFTVVRGDYGPMELTSSSTGNATNLSALETLLDPTISKDGIIDRLLGRRTPNNEPDTGQGQDEQILHDPSADKIGPEVKDEAVETTESGAYHATVDIEPDQQLPSTHTRDKTIQDSTTDQKEYAEYVDVTEKVVNDHTEDQQRESDGNAIDERGRRPQPDFLRDDAERDVRLDLVKWHTSSSKPHDRKYDDRRESPPRFRERPYTRVRRYRVPGASPPPPPRPVSPMSIYSREIDRERIYIRPRIYPTGYERSYVPDPPSLTFFWASQIDIEIGPFASPWKCGVYRDTLESLGIMVELAITALSQLGVESQSAGTTDHEIRYVKFPGDVLLNDLWTHLRDGGHTWPAYAVNGRGGITEPAPHERIAFAAFPNEPIPPLLLVDAVVAAKYSTSGLPIDHLLRERTVELASIDYWLSHASGTAAILTAETNILGNVPAILEEIWTEFFDQITNVVGEKWSSEGNFQEVQELATSMSQYMEAYHSPAARYFLWVAFLRATKVWQCMAIGANTSSILHWFHDDILIYLA